MKKSVTYTFDVDDAIRYGVDEAIILSNIRFWVFTNQAKRRNFKNERYWTYNSAEALTRLYPFWSRRKIARLLVSLEEMGGIVSTTGKGRERTKWYSVDTIDKDGNFPLDKSDQWRPPLDKNDQPLDKVDESLDKYDQSLYIQIENKDQKQDGKEICFDGFNKELRESKEFAEAWIDWIAHRKEKKKPLTDRAMLRAKKTLNRFELDDCLEAIDCAIQSGWTGLFPKRGKGADGRPINDGEQINKLI